MATPLAPLTTLRVGGEAMTFVSATTEAELIDAITMHPHATVLGGGSNIVVSDEGLDVVIAVANRGIALERADDSVLVTAAAGESWDELVGAATDHQWTGIEAMSGIPGLVGAAPMQNIGAYGQDLAGVCEVVRVYDQHAREVLEFDGPACGFGYRSSRFKLEPGRYAVLSVTLRLGTSGHSPVTYAQLAERLGIEVGAIAPTRAIAAAVRELRAAKGMLLDPDDHDTWSTGSYFTNPVLRVEAEIPAGCPTYPVDGARVKASAAWLIEHAGIERGFGLNERATVSTKHTLALTNRGHASANDIVELAEYIAHRVEDAFGIGLEPEARLLGRFG